MISTSRPGPEVMRRTAVEFTEKLLIVRFEVGFPANGRTINAQELEKILLDSAANREKCLYYQAWDKRLVQEGFELAENQQKIREVLEERNWWHFVQMEVFCHERAVCPASR